MLYNIIRISLTSSLKMKFKKMIYKIVYKFVTLNLNKTFQTVVCQIFKKDRSLPRVSVVDAGPDFSRLYCIFLM